MLTVSDVQNALPATLKGAVTQTLVDDINNCSTDPEYAEMVRNNYISYSGVLREGKYKTEDYLNAVMYVSYKLMGLPNSDAYAKTFPHRYQTLVANGADARVISSYVSAYAKGKLVNSILEQTLIPVHVLCHDVYMKAIKVQAELMESANSEKVRSDAANSLLTHLGKPKEASTQVNLALIEDNGMKELKDALIGLAQGQLKAIEAGTPAYKIAEQRLIEHDPQ